MRMMDWLDGHIHLLTLLWLFPILFMFHDFEEILTVEKWIGEKGEGIYKRLPAFARKVYGGSFQMNTFQFAKDVLWVFIIIVTVTAITVFFDFYLLFLAVLHVFFAHVFTHVGQSILLRMYTPGVITSIFIVLPYSIYAYYRLFAEQVIDTQDLYISIVLMLILLPFALFMLLKGRRRNTAS
ncbi:HXXEE domain-containing protein [Paenibacillus albiflavus]|uniref:HXXEE domain-containing protein n=2 Tax=Paenibacillus albiflavus TaxID=2545760 RepID=A0A4R4EKJ1_9BACL|nr:HXXEE domain-containing protein [Paenibacillus albiflavus]